MSMKLTAAALFCSTILGSAAIAQNQASPPVEQIPLGSTDSKSENTQFVIQQGFGVLRVSDLIGQNIYGANNKSVGTVADVVLNRNGAVDGFVIQVGGALGVGSRKIAVPIHNVQVDPRDTTATTGTIPGAGLPASTAEGQKVRNESRISNILTPERILLTIPAEQIESAPAFQN